MNFLRRASGTWYFVVVIASAGVFAAVPFAHAAHRLRKPSLWRWTAFYAAATIVLMIIMPSSTGQAAASTTDVRSTIGGLGAIAIMIAACIQLNGIRRDVYGLPQPVRPPLQPPQPWAADPTVAAALALRTRREEARALVARDPALARDLRIGRPDLPRQYDDGGLVDINTAPPSVIARCCGLDDRAAAQIEQARQQHPVPFQSVDELLVFAELDVTTWDLLRERAVVYS
ncbi:helix-hairpin-helix domain-containing protein [Actinosynnema sp. NPDC053489]|uniref:helix-hairpin-helix domain-containing protein n=1 Tax=Actinosynnema sp. NPDC053489 TaxID=3363916 RepID=UPI0037C5B4B4